MRRRRTSRVTLAVALLAALPAAGADAARPQAQELLVGFRSGVARAQQDRALEQAGATPKRRFARIGAVLVSGRADALRKDPRVRYVEPNRDVTADADPSYGQLWGLENTGQLVGFSYGVPDADTDAPDAWPETLGGGVVVAVTDTGIDTVHPDLATQMWRNPGETPGNRVDDDGNGYVDDVHGWDFANDDANPSDDHGHGTHVAGTVAAARDNGVGVVGVAPGARLMAVKFLDADGVGTLASAVESVLYAGANGASVINASWGDSEFSQALHDAIESVDALIVASAGNSASDNDDVAHYPSGFDLENVVSVAATDNRDSLAWFSNVGAKTVDLGAPGVAIYSTWPGGGYRLLDGTSMASPHVSGAAALARAARPGSSTAALKSLLLATADARPSLAGVTATGARLNANAAVRCSGPTLWLESPSDPLEAYLGEPLQIRARAQQCGSTGGVTVEAYANGVPIELAGGNGVYTGSFTPTEPQSLTIEVRASADGTTVTRTAAGVVSPVLSITPGGSPVTVNLAAGQNAKLTFTGTAGRRISANATGVTIRSATLTLLEGSGAAVGASLFVGVGGGFLEPRQLPADGTYAFVVDPAGSAAGSITLTAFDVPPDVDTALPFSSPTSLTLSVPGQNGRANFQGAAGRSISLRVTGTIPGVRVSILTPSGATLASPLYVGTSGGFVEPRKLSADGVYTVFVDPNAAATGAVTLTLYDVPPDATAALGFGTPATLTTTVPGQNARASFSGSGGRTVSLKVSGVTMSGALVSIVSATGSTLAPASYVGTSGGFVEPRTLPGDGSYTVVVDPLAAATGSITLTLYDVPPDTTTTLGFGTATTVTTTVPGQNARATFAGAAGSRVSLTVAQVTAGTVRISVLTPSGANVVTPFAVGSSGGFVEPQLLAAAGTYAVVVDPQAAGTGSVTLTLYDVPSDASGTLAVGGTTTLTVRTPGQNALATFAGTAGQPLTLKLSGVTLSLVLVRVSGPDGATVVAPGYVGTGGKTLTFTPTRSGEHTVFLDPYRAYTGSATLSLT